MKRRVLFVAYAFPPVGGGGVQRVVKFLKYLPRHGWEASVLTVANPSVPVLDHSLERDVPRETLVCRAPTLEPGYPVKAVVSASPTPSSRAVGGLRRVVRKLAAGLLQPDPQVLWLPAALGAGRNLLRDKPHDAIVASGPPFSSFLLAARLSAQARLPLVLDFRDEWDMSRDYEENRTRGPFARLAQSRLQRYAVRRARVLVATTRASAGALERVARQVGATSRVAHIYNGYDPEDFLEWSPRPNGGGRYRLVYTGTLWTLTTVQPLVEAILTIARQNLESLQALELVFSGRRTPEQESLLARLNGLPCRVERHPYLDHAKALELMRFASGLLLLLADLPGASRVVPAKLFEYLAARRRILAIAPPGEVWDLLAPFRARCVSPADVAGIARCLRREIDEDASGTGSAADAAEPGRYSREALAGELASLLTSLLSESVAVG